VGAPLDHVLVAVGNTVQDTQNPQFKQWTIYIKDCNNAIESVIFHLDETFQPKEEIVTSSPWQISRNGWGEFDIMVTIKLVNGETHQLTHSLSLSANIEHQHALKLKFPFGPVLFCVGQLAKALPDGNWDWQVFVKDPSRQVSKVKFLLHKTFQPNSVVLSSPPYVLNRTGWGEFEIKVKIYFSNGIKRFYYQPLQFNNPSITTYLVPLALSKQLSTPFHESWLNQGGKDSYISTSLATHLSLSLSDFVVPWGDWHRLPVDSKIHVGKSIVDKLKRFGFFYVSNASVSPQLIESAFLHSMYFFDNKHKVITKPIKADVRSGMMKTKRGYSDIRKEGLNPNLGKDLKESFDFGLAVSGDDEHNTHVGANKWPAEGVPGGAKTGFKDTSMKYIKETYNFSREILQAISVGLDLELDTIDQFFDKPLIINRYLKYPPQQISSTLNEMGAGSHVDFGGLTIISQDSEGLEIVDPQMNWIMLPSIPNSFVVTTGYSLEKITNGIIPATKHRVINRNNKNRYSFAFFLDPNPTKMMHPLAHFGVPKYEPCVPGHKGVIYTNPHPDK